jgi:hypothetical protein
LNGFDASSLLEFDQLKLLTRSPERFGFEPVQEIVENAVQVGKGIGWSFFNVKQGTAMCVCVQSRSRYK